MSRLLLVILVLGQCWALTGPAASAELPNLERMLVKQAPTLLRQLKAQGYRNVGVLKFQVHKEGADRPSDNVGSLNLLMAQRLEVALVLANDPREPIGIIRGASEVAQRTPGANHLKPAGRLRLFEPDYPLAWGGQTVKVDAFITGLVGISNDLRTLTISLLAFDRKSQLVSIMDDFKAASRPGALAEMGESFLLRGGFDDGEPGTPGRQQRKQQAALQAAIQVKDGEAPHPAAARGAPATLTILYDGKVVPLKRRAGTVVAPEPQENQKVAFRLRRDNSDKRYGVVLKVNGENVLRKQRLPELACRKLVLEPGVAPLEVRGFQIDRSHRVEFRGLSARQSRGQEMDYGADVGTVTLTVFEERKGMQPPAKPSDLTDEAAEAEVVASAGLPKNPPKDFATLKNELLQEANRGLIGSGNRERSETRQVPFTADPTPVMTLTVVYYRPQPKSQ